MKKYLQEYLNLLKFVKSYRGMLLLAVLCMGVSTLFEGISLGMIIPLSDRILTNKEIIIPGDLPAFLNTLIQKANSTKPLTFLKLMVMSLPLLFLAKGVFIFIQDYLMNIIGQGVIKEVRNSLYVKFQELSLDFYSRSRTGELMSRITNDVNVITNSISYALKDLIFESMKVVLFAFLSFYIGFKISWILPLIAFVIFPLIMFPVIKLGKRIKKFAVEIQKKIADLNSLMAETIQGAYIVKAFCRENYEIERFKEINHQYYRFMLKTVKRTLVLSPLTEFIGVLGTVCILWIIGREVIEGRLSFGVFGAFLAFLLSMIRPLKKLSNVHAINQRALAASERIYTILEEEPQVVELPEAEEIKEFKDKIEFRDVWFKYSREDDCVLRNINLEVKKGEAVALVGHSGAGKTTLVGFLPRFYDPFKGEVVIDGRNVKNFTLGSLRSLVSVVSQDTVLFNASIRDNIAYGKHDAGDKEVVEAAKKAHAYEFISTLPRKFDTMIGDRGLRLSGGEKQRLAIARAILKDAPILILDEATSQLDSVSEQLIKEALYTLMEGRTSFIIAHRLSTVQRADKIIVLEEGQIKERGNHAQLTAADTLYKKLYSLQFE
ncbi:MAG: ATP-binding cassette domain-containing protein [Candidatus Omnitrophica bacterium]|nr:ATP-binding cassette domain-containing protein [Candidatus Omnitrophota bacterium]MBD3268645.1 ATP-binding cassette domain-containing protein [Candidatus Omnitrophota bacterium]